MARQKDPVFLFNRILRLYSHPILVVVFLMAGAIFLAAPRLFATVLPPLFRDDFHILAFVFIFWSAVATLFNYLQGQSGEERVSRTYDYGENDRYNLTATIHEMFTEQRDFVEKELGSIREAMDTGGASRGVDLSNDEKLKLVTDVSASIQKTLNESFLRAVDSKYSEQAVRDNERRLLLHDVELVRQRLTTEINALRRRANSNLAIGSITTFMAMALLAFVALGRTTSFDTGMSMLSYYVPRISFVVFIEVFAYFFLRLYKANLGDIKFYQNELTTVESKALALKSALAEGKSDALTAILKQLSTTERNFVLKKGETTVELERERIESARALEAVRSLRHVLGSARPPSRK
jgi:hypothetical protein